MFGRNRNKEKVEVSKDSWKKARRFFRFLKPYRALWFLGWLCLIFSSLTAMLFPALMGQLLGTKEGEASIVQVDGVDLTSINVVLVTMLVVFGFQAIFSFSRMIIFTVVTERALKDLKYSAFDRLIHMPINYFNKNKVGELTSRIATDVNLVQKTLQTTFAEFFRQIITIIFGLAAIFYFSWELALWMLAVLPILAVIAIIFGRYIRKLAKQATDESAQSNTILEEVLTGIVNVKAFTGENYERGKYDSRVTKIKSLEIKSGLMRGIFIAFIIFCMFGGIAFVIWKAKQMEGTEITTAEFNAFILYTLFLGASFGSIPDLYAQIQKAIGSTERIMDIVDEPAEEEFDKKLKRPFSGRVSFKNVHFSYPQRSEITVLKDVSFDCDPGHTTALVGGSGAGKTTISSLLMKFYKLDSGSILFDDQDISDLNNEDLRSEIAIVPQEVILFGGSVLENIRYGRQDATDEEVMEAAKKANAYDFVMGFPDQFETLVGDRGIQLSGGQKQRVAIARAVLKDPKILILDEATSALDSESERLVQDALDKLMIGRTSFVIAHRLSTIRNAHTILVLEKGEIVEQGTHDDLMSRVDGVYHRLNSTQLEA